MIQSSFKYFEIVKDYYILFVTVFMGIDILRHIDIIFLFFYGKLGKEEVEMFILPAILT